jgi:proteasome lid subunit RPN8/RPN11
MKILLRRKDLKKMLDHTKKISPKEACGIILGTFEGDFATVERIKNTRNVLNSSVRFQIRPEDFINALNEAERMGWEVIGFYHSHPAKACPSAVDERFMRLWPDKIWVIVSLIDHSLGAYIFGEKTEEVEIEII